MKTLLILGALAACVLIMDKWYDRLPKPLQRVYDLWEKFSHMLGAVMSRVILTILWIVGFGPYAIIGRMIGRHTTNPPRDTYWIDVAAEATGNLRNQF